MTPAPIKICIVDDEPRGRQLLLDVLSLDGYDLFTAVDGDDALAVITARQPDIVLLDVMMPRLDGFAVCQRLRADARTRHATILLMTALDDRKSRLRGIESGADDFITKPFDGAELRARVRTIARLNRYRLLSEERERFFTALSLAPDGVVITAPDGTVHFANEAYLQLLEPDISHRPPPTNVFAPLPADRTEALQRELGRLTPGRHLAPFATSLQTASGLRDVELTAALLTWNGAFAIQFNVRDVTEKKRLELQLLKSQRLELLGQLASGVIHDVNNVLGAILGGTQIHAMQTGKTDPMMAVIEKSARRGSDILRQVLLFARGVDSEVVDLDPGQIVAELAHLVQTTFGNCYKVECVRPTLCPVVRADPNQLHQVIMNLCVNARDAMPKGGRIRLEVAEEHLTDEDAARLGGDASAGHYLTIHVSDTGHGIPPDVLPRLFDPFFSTKETGKGTGLGLATVQRILRLHDGFVSVSTRIGEGSTFSCHLPVSPAGVPRPALP